MRLGIFCVVLLVAPTAHSQTPSSLDNSEFSRTACMSPQERSAADPQFRREYKEALRNGDGDWYPDDKTLCQTTFDFLDAAVRGRRAEIASMTSTAQSPWPPTMAVGGAIAPYAVGHFQQFSDARIALKRLPYSCSECSDWIAVAEYSIASGARGRESVTNEYAWLSLVEDARGRIRIIGVEFYDAEAQPTETGVIPDGVVIDDPN